MRAWRLVSFLVAGSLSAGGCAAEPRASADSAVTSHSRYIYDDPVVQTQTNPPSWIRDDSDAVNAVATQTPANAIVTPDNAPAPTTIDASIRDVRGAMNLDAAVDAYAAGLAVDHNNIDLQKAYLQKVVEFDSPNLGMAAAQQVIAVEPDNGLARAVQADAEARRGAMVDALTDLSIAVRHAPDSPFVRKTAGHLMAWYDNSPRSPSLPSGVRESLQQSRPSVEKSPAYAAAYQEATAYLREERSSAAGDATNPATRPSGTAEAQPDYTPYTGAYNGGSGDYYTAAPSYQPTVAYDYPYAYGPYAYDYWGSYPYWGWGWGGPWFGFSFFDFNNRLCRFHDRDFDRGHRDFHDRGSDRGFHNRFFGHDNGFGRDNRSGRGNSFGRTNGSSTFRGSAFSSSPRILTPGVGRNFSSSSGARFGGANVSRGSTGSRFSSRATPSFRDSSGFRSTSGFRGGSSFRGGGMRSGGSRGGGGARGGGGSHGGGGGHR